MKTQKEAMDRLISLIDVVQKITGVMPSIAEIENLKDEENN